jgi:alpha/beta superfamily hydrolase
MINERKVTLAVAPDVILDGHLAVPSPVRGGVALCHPHPLYGGDMENPVVVRAAEVCAAAGLATLRFDFRGVGASTGAHDEGRGEQDDLLAALGHVDRAIPPGLPLAALGYSFGAAIAARVAIKRASAGAALTGVALVAPALAVAALADLDGLASVSGRILIAAGTNDSYCPLDALKRLGSAVPNATVRTVEGADHFFFGKLYPLGEIVGAWALEIAGPAR